MNINITVTGGEIPQEEINAYIDRGQRKYGKYLRGIDIQIDGEYVELAYDVASMPAFQRIRRITGYLVGDLSRFNNGKRAEEQDRVKHGISQRTDLQ